MSHSINITNQKAREQKSIDDGKATYHKNLNRKVNDGTVSDLKPVAYAGDPYVEALAISIQDKIVTDMDTNSNRKPVFGKLLGEADPFVIARCAIAEILTQSMKKNKDDVFVIYANASAAAIGRCLDTTRMNEILFEQNKDFYKTLLKRSLPAGELYEALARIKDVEGLEPWSDAHRMTIGGVLLELAINAGIITKTNTWIKGKEVAVVGINEEMLERLETSVEREALLAPSLTPMIVKPLEWSTTTDGGYLTLTHDLVKRYMDAQHRADVANSVEQGNFDLASVNAAQNTGWQVNLAMLEVVQYCYANHIEIDGLTDSNRNTTTALRRQVYRAMDVAKDLVDEDAFYFPATMDYRGRLYYLPATYNPQGSKPIKSMLQLASGDILDESSARMLAIHIANCAGMDKAPLQERVDWVNSDETMELLNTIVNMMRDGDFEASIPLWSGMDDPFNFLAAIMEYVPYKRGELVVSLVNIALDGSCNGYQHVAALMLDEETAARVNLVPDMDRQDIYADVQGATAAKLPELVAGITRDTMKTPVMTIVYGSKQSQMGSHVRKAHKKAVEKAKKAAIKNGTEAPVDPLKTEDLSLIGKEAYNTVGEICPSMLITRDWLQKVAGEHAERGEAMRWTTADGLPVAQLKLTTKTMRPKFKIGGKDIYLTQRVDTKIISEGGMKNAVAANVTHSLDATHLRMVAAACASEGIPIGLIHDSFSTSAAHASRLFEIVREQFVKLYEQDVLGNLAKDLKAEDAPERGTLDIQGVLKTEYSFA